MNNEQRDLWLELLRAYITEAWPGRADLPEQELINLTDPAVLAMFWLEAARIIREDDRAAAEYEERTGRTIH